MRVLMGSLRNGVIARAASFFSPSTAVADSFKNSADAGGRPPGAPLVADRGSGTCTTPGKAHQGRW
jgi:hypothetical protein